MKKHIGYTAISLLCSFIFYNAYHFADEAHVSQLDKYNHFWIPFKPIYMESNRPAARPWVEDELKNQYKLTHLYGQIGRAWMETTVACLPFILEPSINL